MALSKLWLFLVTLVGAAAVAVLLVAPRPLDDELARETGARLERAQQAASLLFQVNGRRWIDSAAQAASDAVLVESLSEASRGPADLVIVHRTVQDRLRHFGGQLHAELALATDAKGRVIARFGPDDGAWKDGVEGLPLVADALRGMRGDDTWAVDGRVYRVVATPVMTRERYVGALVVGQELGGQLAQSMKQALGTDVAILLRGRVVASSAQGAAASAISQLPVLAEREAETLRSKGRTGALAVGGDAPSVAVMATLPGDLGARALVAVIAPRVPVGAPIALVQRALGDIGKLPPSTLAAIGGGALLALIIGLLLIRLEAERPQRRLASDAQRLARGESQRLDDDLHPGKLGIIARAVNTALDRLGVRTVPSRAAMEGGNGNGPTIGGPVAAPPRRLPTPGETSTLSQADVEARKALLVETGAYPVMPDELKPPSLSGAPVAAPVADVGTDAVPTSVRDADLFADPPTVQAKHPPTFDAVDAPAKLRAELPSTAAAGPPLREIVAEPAFHDDEEATSVASADALQQLAQADYAAARAAEQAAELKKRATTIPPIATMPPAPAGSRPSIPAIPPPPPSLAPSAPTVQGPAPGSAAAAGDPDEAELRRVYQEFVETKQRLGEPTEGVTFEKFAGKLRANRNELMGRFACKSVRFQVYVKDGKAALKATPVT